MGTFDVFNGDADGICALQQLRLVEPLDNTLITGVKREISLLDRVQAGEGDDVTVLDISLAKNREGLKRLLEQGARVQYFDHHAAGEIPVHKNLTTILDPSPDICTSLLVDRHLKGKFRAWAVVGAFGDNLDQNARQYAKALDLGGTQLKLLRDLGVCLNYNAYGTTVEDLFFPPDELFRRVQPHRDPFSFIAEDETMVRLRNGYADDMARAENLRPEIETEKHALYILPSAAWARRVSGVFANQLAQGVPKRAHALLTRLPEGGYVVSVRASLFTKQGADNLCRQFPTGGGREAAAGINYLPEALFDEFVAKFKAAYG